MLGICVIVDKRTNDDMEELSFNKGLKYRLFSFGEEEG